jgi:hypothetical protein
VQLLRARPGGVRCFAHAARVVRAETVHCPSGLIAIDENWPTRKLRPELAETVRDEARILDQVSPGYICVSMPACSVVYTA